MRGTCRARLCRWSGLRSWSSLSRWCVAHFAILEERLHTTQQDSPEKLRKLLGQRGLDRPTAVKWKHEPRCYAGVRPAAWIVLSGLPAWPLSKRHESCTRTAFLGPVCLVAGHGTAMTPPKLGRRISAPHLCKKGTSILSKNCGTPHMYQATCLLFLCIPCNRKYK